jgi:hypothetical protein
MFGLQSLPVEQHLVQCVINSLFVYHSGLEPEASDSKRIRDFT